MIVLKIILLIIGGLLALVLLLLALALFCAVWYSVEARKDGEGIKTGYRLRWLFLIYKGTDKKQETRKKKKRTPQNNKPEKGKPQKPKKKKEKKPLKERTAGSWAAFKGVLETGEFGKLPGYTKTLIKRLFRAVKPKRLKARLVLGFDDPSNTAIAVGAIGGFSQYKNWDIDVKGDFDTPRIEGELYAKGRVRLYRLVFPLIAFILKKPVWAIIFPKK